MVSALSLKSGSTANQHFSGALIQREAVVGSVNNTSVSAEQLVKDTYGDEKVYSVSNTFYFKQNRGSTGQHGLPNWLKWMAHLLRPAEHWNDHSTFLNQVSDAGVTPDNPSEKAQKFVIVSGEKPNFLFNRVFIPLVNFAADQARPFAPNTISKIFGSQIEVRKASGADNTVIYRHVLSYRDKSLHKKDLTELTNPKGLIGYIQQVRSEFEDLSFANQMLRTVNEMLVKQKPNFAKTPNEDDHTELCEEMSVDDLAAMANRYQWRLKMHKVFRPEYTSPAMDKSA